jgi:hypothetical protein
MEQQRSITCATLLSGKERSARIFEIQQSESQLAPGAGRNRGAGRRRRQWGTVQGRILSAATNRTHRWLANASFLIHLAIASLGLTSEWVSIHIQEPYKRILGIPDLLMVYLIIPSAIRRSACKACAGLWRIWFTASVTI